MQSVRAFKVPPRRKVAVVIGGGIAGATCATELMSLCRPHVSSLEVIIVAPTPVVKLPSAGPLKHQINLLTTPATEWAKDQGVTFIQDFVVAISDDIVTLSKGQCIKFDLCCVASGARPRVPASLLTHDEALQSRILVVRDIDTVSTLSSAVSRARHVIIVGNGGIALELVHSIRDCFITWVIKNKHIGNAFFDSRGGDALFRILNATRSSDRKCKRSTRICGKEQISRGKNESVESETSKLSVDSPPSQGGGFGAGVGPNWVGHGGKCIFKGSLETDGNETRAPGLFEMQIEYECEVKSVSKGTASQHLLDVELSNGKCVACDYVICATGVEPNVDFISTKSGIALDSGKLSDQWEYRGNYSEACRGVLVHHKTMRSISSKSVYAAGDCATVVNENASAQDVPSARDNWFQMRLWTQAAIAGRNAAANMAVALSGSQDTWAGVELDVFAHSTEFFGRPVVFLGRYNAQGLTDGYEVLESGGGANDERFVRVVLDRGKVRGALLVGDTELSETYENLINDCLDVSHLGMELVAPSIDLADYFD